MSPVASKYADATLYAGQQGRGDPVGVESRSDFVLSLHVPHAVGDLVVPLVHQRRGDSLRPGVVRPISDISTASGQC